jgi:hypothetical protein
MVVGWKREGVIRGSENINFAIGPYKDIPTTEEPATTKKGKPKKKKRGQKKKPESELAQSSVVISKSSHVSIHRIFFCYILFYPRKEIHYFRRISCTE